jgi:hypothetical protein
MLAQANRLQASIERRGTAASREDCDRLIRYYRSLPFDDLMAHYDAAFGNPMPVPEGWKRLSHEELMGMYVRALRESK